jgi:hypothetical protein
MKIQNKYRAKRTEFLGRTYDSRKEADYAQKLELLKQNGEISFWIPQISVPLSVSSKNRHIIDFMIVFPNGTIEFHEVKGRDLTVGRMKRQMLWDNYKIEIKVV